MSSRAQKLIVRTEDGSNHELVVKSGAALVIGRGKDSDLQLDFKSVSRQHCQLELDPEGRVEVVDLGSQNGTRLNGKRVERAGLKTGDELLVATVPLRIEIVAAPARAKFDVERQLSSEERKLRRDLADIGLEIIDRADLGSPVPVYRAHRRDLEQDVLVKAVQFGEDDPEAAENAQRLLRAAKLAAKMRHRNVVQIYDVRQFPGLVAIICEFVEGRTLAQEIARKGVVDPGRCVAIAIEVCLALEHAHDAGVVHRNIQPGTIMVSKAGEVKVVDFGLAKSIAKGPGLTLEGQSLGEAEYSAPEQIRDASNVDHRADIYALGATLYHALSGQVPRVQITPRALQDSHGALVPTTLTSVAPALPEVVRAVVERAMKSKRDERYQTAEQFRRALEAALAALRAAARSDTAEQAVARIAAGATGKSGTGFVGRIQTDELIELLQMVEYNRKSGTLEIYGTADEKRVSGSVIFRDGTIVDARAGDHRGADALFELFLLPGGNFRVVYGERAPAPDETLLNISATIMELMRRRDETKRQEREMPTPPPGAPRPD